MLDLVSDPREIGSRVVSSKALRAVDSCTFLEHLAVTASPSSSSRQLPLERSSLLHLPQPFVSFILLPSSNSQHPTGKPPGGTKHQLLDPKERSLPDEQAKKQDICPSPAQQSPRPRRTFTRADPAHLIWLAHSLDSLPTRAPQGVDRRLTFWQSFHFSASTTHQVTRSSSLVLRFCFVFRFERPKWHLRRSLMERRKAC